MSAAARGGGFALAVGIMLQAASADPVSAAGPLVVAGNGAAAVWGAGPVPYNPDQGPLGVLDNATATANIDANFAVWSAVSTATVATTNAGALPVDVTAANVTTILGQCDGLSPIVYDTDGSIVELLFGAGASASVLGFAGPECTSVDVDHLRIDEGSAVLNGRFIDGVAGSDPEVTVTQFNGVFAHEFGHYLNLGHSQVNRVEAFDSDLANNEAIPTMFPFFSPDADFQTLHLDDEVSLSSLYPTAPFATDFGTIEGEILRRNGTTPFQGAYVVARSVSDPRAVAVGAASGHGFRPGALLGPPTLDLLGAYALPGLPPGSYTVEVEEIDPRFVFGSAVGPFAVPRPLPGPPEFWNGVDEAADDPPDDPADAVSLAVSAGATTADIDIVLNQPLVIGAGIEAGGLVFTGEIHSNAARGGDTPFLLAPRHLVISPDGAQVYVWADTSSRMLVYLRDPSDGTLTLLAVQQFQSPSLPSSEVPRAARSMEFSPDGAFLYVANANARDRGVVVLSRDPALGLLSVVEVREDPHFDQPLRLTLSPDGAHLYMTDASSDAGTPERGGALFALERDAGTGELSVVQSISMVTLDFDLRRPEAVAVSPDGSHVYVSSRVGATIAVFARDAGTGALTLLNVLRATDGVTDRIEWFAMSPDGAHLYATSPDDGSITAFARDPGTGQLALVETLTKAISSLGRPQQLTISPDGRHVYVPESQRGSLLTFLRDETSGRLRFLGEHREGRFGIVGIFNPLVVVASPDGKNAYLATPSNRVGKSFFEGADLQDGTLITFVRDACGSGALSGDEQCDDGNLVDADGCSALCRLELCAPAPVVGCLDPGKASLQYKLKDEVRKDSLVWKWSKGAATDVSDLGDPLTDASYQLCLYDSSGSAQPLRTLALPAGGVCAGKPCWKTAGTKGFKYKDKGRAPDGVEKGSLKAGDAGKSKVLAKGKGALLQLPTPPLVPPVTVQLHNSETGVCWSAEFSTLLTNESDRLKAKSN